jgi:hypothetical protein
MMPDAFASSVSFEQIGSLFCDPSSVLYCRGCHGGHTNPPPPPPPPELCAVVVLVVAFVVVAAAVVVAAVVVVVVVVEVEVTCCEFDC